MKGKIYLAYLMRTPLADFDLSTYILNRLQSADIITVGDLISHSRTDLMRIHYLGIKCLRTLDNLVCRLGLEYGKENKCLLKIGQDDVDIVFETCMRDVAIRTEKFMTAYIANILEKRLSQSKDVSGL